MPPSLPISPACLPVHSLSYFRSNSKPHKQPMGNQRRTRRSSDRKMADDRFDLLHGEANPRRPRRKNQQKGADEEWQTLNAQIGALESFLSGAVARAERQRRQKLENILPPPDRSDPSQRRNQQRMSRWQERHYYEDRQRHGITFFFLFCAVCALLWWLLHASNGM